MELIKNEFGKDERLQQEELERDCLIGWELLERELRKGEPTSDSAYDDAFQFFLDVDLSMGLAMLIEINELMQNRIIGEGRVEKIMQNSGDTNNNERN